MLELATIEDTVQHVAEAIASVLELDVSIIDRRYVRLGATGLYAGAVFLLPATPVRRNHANRGARLYRRLQRQRARRQLRRPP